MNLLPNTGTLGGERQDFRTLAFFQILQANLHSVPELEGVSIGASTSRQLSESHRFGLTEIVSLLECRQDSTEDELSPIRKADCTYPGRGGKHPF